MEPSRKNLYTKNVKGHTYHYHRPTMTRLKQDYNTPAFWRELNDLNTKDEPKEDNAFLEKALSSRVNPRKDTIAKLIDSYLDSTKFKYDLRGSTKKLYEHHLDIVKTAIGSLVANDVDTAVMQALHDQIARSRGYRTAQLANTHMKLVFNWGNKFGWLNGRANPCNSIDLAKSSKSNHNRRWTQEELDNALLNLPKHLATAVALASYTGLRKSDVIKWEWHQYDENTGRIAGLTQKTSTTIDLPVHAKLKVILANADRFKDCTRIVASKRSPKGFTAMGFQASWQKAKAKLIEDGHCKEGITFHGLRHTIANALAEAGCAPLEIMAITGHTDAASVEAYIKEASKKRMADSGFQKLKAWEALYLNAPRISTDNESEISEAA